MRIHSDQYKEIFLNDLPLMDMRAPVEFSKGAFPQALNLPLMNDEERRKVGTCYKKNGQQAAIDLGNRLVSGTLKAERIAAWADFARKHPDGYLYCFRGGLRSQIAQQWLKAEADLDYPRVPGGYKAMRNFLIETIVAAQTECRFILVGGFTGTGKTELLLQLPNVIDLEGHAHHRGSSFGKHATPQPGQIDFENALAIDFLKKRAQGHQTFVLEDESRMIGRCALPQALRQTLQQDPLIWLEDSLANRTERILGDYVIDLCAEFISLHGDESGITAFAEHLRLSLRNISKRLGMERYQRLAAIMDNALAEQQRSGSVDGHRGWIEGLLAEYYDPMYAHQQESRAEQIVFRGDRQAVMEYLQTRVGDQRLA
ncbi:tRNA 2-selenouridine(34) synthase MnmH [Pollutimonas harenae]|uniref:tRNA 2-selenouridine synthase n=1 Tax=Pollutimonas harenae TaxID=657015 RepID=A0A853GZ92_9BURK|nr:tRNA 2-selenouridine(34) synthase MnmH [Pollutimonas harenae]NYT85422.1 tRNA 2-selenouridine(34) synthase MnmH [Pollutimonas harenae]TEA70516.1 tRNA 2-selenouridine(34) synthase MnmH [Pollutimonas harenae]